MAVTPKLLSSVALSDYHMDSQVSSPSTGATVTVAQNQSPHTHVVIETGTLANLTINMPSSPYHGQVVSLFFQGIVTTLVLGNGTFINTLTAATALLGSSFVFDTSDNKWHRCK